MVSLNPYFQRLKRPYLFPVIEEKLRIFRNAHPDIPLLNLGIGDIALPLAPSIASAIIEAVQEMTLSPRGYGPSEGYDFLRKAICQEQYASFGVEFEEIFISDGTNTDVTAIYDLFEENAKGVIADPAYPAYLDAAYLSGKEILLLPTSASQRFIPIPPQEKADFAILCTPSNPTGVAFSQVDLQRWIDWALFHKAILILDNVYAPFVTSKEVPPSIYALPHGLEVAIELRSFSKGAGFTGLRCASMVIPKQLHSPLHSLWKKRINIRSNGISYPIQKGALATFSEKGKTELRDQIHLYQTAAAILREALTSLGETFFGGIDAPYIFWKCPHEMGSWDFVDVLLEKAHLLAIPGVGFGPSGEGFVRLSCFITPEQAQRAAHALRRLHISA